MRYEPLWPKNWESERVKKYRVIQRERIRSEANGREEFSDFLYYNMFDKKFLFHF